MMQKISAHDGCMYAEVSSSCILRSVFLEPFVKVGVAKRCGGI